MHEVMERMAKVIAKQNEQTKHLEEKVISSTKEVKKLNHEIDQQASNFDDVLALLGQSDKISDPQDDQSISAVEQVKIQDGDK